MGWTVEEEASAAFARGSRSGPAREGFSQGGGHEVSSNWHRHDPGEDNDHTMGVDDEDADLRRLADCIQHHWRLVQHWKRQLE